ncbi:MAG TPA: DNA mismatch repair protein MutS, partial [Patescibacteria group bacterium]
DQATIRNLEIFNTLLEGKHQGSLLSVIDRTETAMGGRLLRSWLLQPLINKDKIDQRLSAVAELTDQNQWRQTIADYLKKVADIERLAGRIGCQRATARDLIALKSSLEIIPRLKEILKQARSDFLVQTFNQLAEHQSAVDLIGRAIVDEPPLSIQAGGLIKDNYDQELDSLREIAYSGKDWIRKMQAEEIERTGINSLKVKFNKVFGYYIEISKTNLDSVPENYIRKQTLVNAERFITPELKEYEEKVLGAEDKIKQLEYNLFLEIRNKLSEHLPAIQKSARLLARLDVLVSFADLALANNYCRPVITDDDQIIIKDGRHPVIETINSDPYIPNDSCLNSQDHLLILLTGPNMSGKSSYLRQVALIVLMAQIGCYVPAKEASLSLVDRIFTRVGASDNLAAGCSTFMMEMQEAANIINNATDKSLIILDELGRGTSTYDGVSIAWAVVEYLHNHLKAKTLFATHYHELIEAAESLSKAQNYSVAVKENKTEGVIFLRKVIKGGIDKSYGVEVAKLAGLPQDLIMRSLQILHKLENGHLTNGQDKQKTLPLMPAKKEEPLAAKLKNLDLENMTPLEALKKLEELRQEAQGTRQG